MTELLPCPFCGLAPRVIEDTQGHDFQVFCICEADPCFSVPKEDRERAILAWNTRTAPAKGCEAKGEHTCGTSHANAPTPGADRVREAAEKWQRTAMDVLVQVKKHPAYMDYVAVNADELRLICKAALAQGEK